MTPERREFIKNQAAVKQCKRFVLFAEFYLIEDSHSDEISLQEEEDSLTGECSSCGTIDKLSDGQCYYGCECQGGLSCECSMCNPCHACEIGSGIHCCGL